MIRWRVWSLQHVEKKISQLCADLATQAVKSRVSAGSACVDQSGRGYLGRDLFRRRLAGGRSEAALDIINDDLLEIGGQRRTAERHGLFAVDKNRRCRLLAGARQRNADIGVFGFAWTVDDAAHHRDVEALDAWIARLPFRHRVADEALDASRELLKCSRSGTAAAGAGSDKRHECAQAQGLQQFLRDLHLERTIAIGLGGE